eukprot:s1667_g11.t1
MAALPRRSYVQALQPALDREPTGALRKVGIAAPRHPRHRGSADRLVLAASSLSLLVRWSRSPRWRLRGIRLRAEPQQQEYLEEFDALGRELTGKAIIVGWDPGPNRKATNDGPVFSPKESMAELEGLCDTLGVEVKEKVLQQWRPYSGRLPIGTGKAEEMRQQVKYDPEVGVVVFDQDMSYRMLMTLKGRIAPNGECVILDRTSLILRIFAQRARTKEAKLQVKLASLRYMLPRLRYYLTTGAGMEAQGGSVGAGGSASGGGAYLKGKGETQLQMDRTLLKKRISACMKQLEEVRKVRARQRERPHAKGPRSAS